ncbi:hypothetical protein LSCM1_02100 [Leishmania martiniquensis]|uniref:Uncharacterized protein n=1 Tax=Leishmania martiniquensis TaxID=1580590 RepID=A0A836KJM5_9TRYP|nr:hypothetical protein LSCM1_02100 [Leishmania martiniquensis]
MQSRVRLLYLEFMCLLPQLRGFYSPNGSAAAAPTSGTMAPKPFYLRLPDDHPACMSLRSAHITELDSHRQGKRPISTSPAHTTADNAEAPPSLVDVSTAVNAASRMKVFKIRGDHERALVAPFMPANWDNNNSQRPSPSPASKPAPAAERIAEAEYRARVQRLFYANALVPVGSSEWKRCLARGRYELRSIHNVLYVRKYRALHKRYSWASQLSRTELEAAWGGNLEAVEQALLGLSNRDVYGYSGSDTKDGEAERGDEGHENSAGRV